VGFPIILLLFLNIPWDAMTALFTGGLVLVGIIAIKAQNNWSKKMLLESKASSLEQKDLLLKQLSQATESSIEERKLLLQQIIDSKDASFKESSFRLILDLQREFRDLEPSRKKSGSLILEHKILTVTMDYRNSYILKDYLGDIYDLFDTMGLYVNDNLVDSDFIHHNFSYWIFRYYGFYKIYNMKKIALQMGIENTVWSNIEDLVLKMNEIENNKGGGDMINRTFDLEGFFQEESNLISYIYVE
jgi:hypothetical protein